MADFVMIRHESQDDSVEPARTLRAAFDDYYVHKGWQIVGDSPAESPVNDPSPTVAEQTQLLRTDPQALEEILTPKPSIEDAAEADAPKTSTTRGGKK